MCAGTIFYSLCVPHPDPIWQCKLVAKYLLSSSVFGLEGEARDKIDLLHFTFFSLEKYKNSTCVMFQFSSGSSYLGIILNKALWYRLDLEFTCTYKGFPLLSTSDTKIQHKFIK